MMRALAPLPLARPLFVMSTLPSPDRAARIPVFDLGKYLPFKISVLSDYLERTIAVRHEECSGLSSSEWRVLVVVGSTPDIYATQISRQTGLDKVAVSRAVASLVESGHLERHVTANDRRRTLLRLTPDGETAYAETVSIAIRVENDLLEQLDEAEAHALRTCSDRFLERQTDLSAADIRTNTSNKSA